MNKKDMTLRAKLKIAVGMVITNHYEALGRDFDDCFENGDGAIMCRYFWDLYDHSKKLREAVSRIGNIGYFSTDGTIEGIAEFRAHQFALSAHLQIPSFIEKESDESIQDWFLTKDEKRAIREKKQIIKVKQELAEMMA